MFVAPDWTAPWNEPWRVHGTAVTQRLAAGMPLLDALNAGDAPVRFVPAAELPAGEPYERFVHEHRACPTRENLHDFFNALCWLGAPRTKARLNELQAHEIAQAGIGSVRGSVRDAITILDENGAVLQAAPELWNALLARDWHLAFVHLRPAWREARLTIIGHALLEKLQQPRKDLTAHVLAMRAPAGTLDDLDGWLAGRLSAPALAAKPFTPLPVLGIPGWWPQNEDVSFYDDPLVFRPRQRATARAAGCAAPLKSAAAGRICAPGDPHNTEPS